MCQYWMCSPYIMVFSCMYVQSVTEVRLGIPVTIRSACIWWDPYLQRETITDKLNQPTLQMYHYVDAVSSFTLQFIIDLWPYLVVTCCNRWARPKHVTGIRHWLTSQRAPDLSLKHALVILAIVSRYIFGYYICFKHGCHGNQIKSNMFM